MKTNFLLATASLAILLSSCQAKTETPNPVTPAAQPVHVEPQSPAVPTIQDAKEFLDASAVEIDEIAEWIERSLWVKANFITQDTGWIEAETGARYGKLATRLANEAKRYNGLDLPADMKRKLEGLKRGSNFPAPDKPGAAKELATIMSGLDSRYGEGKFQYKSEDPQFAALYQDNPDGNLSLGDLSEIIAKSRNPQELNTVWEGWRNISKPMKKEYTRMVDIINAGSAELGYKDAGDLWRAGYDMQSDAFAQEADRLWTQVKPLYDELHCHVRAELNVKYGDEVVPLDQPIRADLLGNMWAQQWGNIYNIVKPEGPDQTIDLTALLEKNGYTEIEMVKAGENFFTSLGFAPLPDTFWERSLFMKPKDREVVCHASAWNIDARDDLRIKMCIKINANDFNTIHHELGHNIYQRAYNKQPIYYKNGANDGFHEAIGDMIALSITPDYLVEIGLLDEADVPSADADINLLMRQALDKVAFLPFGLMVDQWRWKVFSGEYTPENYNNGWWELREKYQGVRAPGERPADAFDPGAKYHIPGNTPYMRYFLAHILQFQFHKAACDMAGNTGPLHRCSIYGNEAVGAKFNAMMKMGASRPWPEALEAFTGINTMDGSAIVEYFAPLMVHLKEQNKDRKCGW